MSPTLREAYESEMGTAEALRRAGDLDAAFHHLERAHILGQQYVATHVRTHVAMLRIGSSAATCARSSARSCAAGRRRSARRSACRRRQHGGANVGFFAQMEIPPDLKALLDA
jgi:hypothetical protein